MFNKKFLSSTLVALAFSLGANAGGDPAPCAQQQQEVWSDSDDEVQCDAGQTTQQDACQTPAQKGGASVGLAPNPSMPINVANQDCSQQVSQDFSGQFDQMSLQSNQDGWAPRSQNKNWNQCGADTDFLDLMINGKMQDCTSNHAVTITTSHHHRHQKITAPINNCGLTNMTWSKFKFKTTVSNLQWNGPMYKNRFYQEVSKSHLSGPLNGVQFTGGLSDVNFRGAHFGVAKGAHRTMHASFSGPLNNVNFAGAVFESDVSFKGAQFGQNVNFVGAQVAVSVDGNTHLVTLTEKAAAHFHNSCSKVKNVGLFIAGQGFQLARTSGGFVMDLVGGAIDTIHTAGHNTIAAFVTAGGKLIHQGQEIHDYVDSDSDTSSDDENAADNNCNSRQ